MPTLVIWMFLIAVQGEGINAHAYPTQAVCEQERGERVQAPDTLGIMEKCVAVTLYTVRGGILQPAEKLDSAILSQN